MDPFHLAMVEATVSVLAFRVIKSTPGIIISLKSHHSEILFQGSI